MRCLRDFIAWPKCVDETTKTEKSCSGTSDGGRGSAMGWTLMGGGMFRCVRMKLKILLGKIYTADNKQFVFKTTMFFFHIWINSCRLFIGHQIQTWDTTRPRSRKTCNCCINLPFRKKEVLIYSRCTPFGMPQEVCGPHLSLLAPWTTRVLSQWMLHWWRVNGSTARELLFPCTQWCV